MRKRLTAAGVALLAGHYLVCAAGPAVVVLRDPPGIGTLHYRLVGPAWGGRVTAVTGVASDPTTYYAGAAAGGVWKSTDGGISWKPIFDEASVSSVGAIAVAPSNPKVVYLGTGEANPRADVSTGNGLYRSVDGGNTWKHVWSHVGQIGRIVVDASNADIAFAAVLGPVYRPGGARGIYRTTDGGRNWTQVLRGDGSTGAIDLVMDPSQPEILFAALWQERRFPWTFQGSGPGSGLYVSRNGGNSWIRLGGDGEGEGKGLPAGVWGRVGLAIAPSDPGRLYALIEATGGGLFRSNDEGETWRRVSGNHILRTRPWYFSTLTVDPGNADDIWFPESALLRSTNGGKTLSFVENKGWDVHDVWLNPKIPERLIVGSDAGVEVSSDGGATWYAPPLPLGQFYQVAVDSRRPFRIAGSMQDIGTAQGPSDNLDTNGIRNTDWYNVGGGEAGWIAPDPSDPDVVYATEFGGMLTRYDHHTGLSTNVSMDPEDTIGLPAASQAYRFNWVAPLIISPSDPGVLYHAGNVLFRSDDGGQHWLAISGDLTRDEKSKQQLSGGSITKDNSGAETYDTIVSLADSSIERGLIWVGTDDGLVWITRDGGKHWKDVTAGMPRMPKWAAVSMIEPSRFSAGTAYVTVDSHRLGDDRPYLFETTDFGETWRRLDATLPDNVFLNAVREDPVRPEMLYLGTDVGVEISQDGGRTWHSLKANLPAVPVYDLKIEGDDLIVATHGRSIWIFDHLAVLRELTAAVRQRNSYLFRCPDVTRWHLRSAMAVPVGASWRGQNPAGAVTFYYWLKRKPAGDVRIDILDAQGHVVDSLSRTPPSWSEDTDDPADFKDTARMETLSILPGINVVSWDLRYAAPRMIRGAKLDQTVDVRGPLVAPGEYTVRLSVDGRLSERPLHVLSDPRRPWSATDLEEQTQFALQVRSAISEVSDLDTQARGVKKRLLQYMGRPRGDRPSEQLMRASRALLVKLDSIEAQIRRPAAKVDYDFLSIKGGASLYCRLFYLFHVASYSDGPPTQGVRAVFAAQERDVTGLKRSVNAIVSFDWPQIERKVQREPVASAGNRERGLEPLAKLDSNALGFH